MSGNLHTYGICVNRAPSLVPEMVPASRRVAAWRSASQAGIVFTFAVEEFGKAVLLREAQQSAGSDPVTIEGFYEHDDKIEAASKHVDARFLRLTKGAFAPGVFDPSVFDTGRPADLAARMSGLYVDWRGGKWGYGLPVDPTTLSESSRGFRRS